MNKLEKEKIALMKYYFNILYFFRELENYKNMVKGIPTSQESSNTDVNDNPKV